MTSSHDRVRGTAMLRMLRRALMIATLVACAIGPSAAYARFNLEPGGGPSATPPVQATNVVAADARPASTSPGFQWEDAAIGAAGMLALLGATSTLTRRRRVHQSVAR